jgi:hypothetical protein
MPRRGISPGPSARRAVPLDRPKGAASATTCGRDLQLLSVFGLTANGQEGSCEFGAALPPARQASWVILKVAPLTGRDELVYKMGILPAGVNWGMILPPGRPNPEFPVFLPDSREFVGHRPSVQLCFSGCQSGGNPVPRRRALRGRGRSNQRQIEPPTLSGANDPGCRTSLRHPSDLR